MFVVWDTVDHPVIKEDSPQQITYRPSLGIYSTNYQDRRNIRKVRIRLILIYQPLKLTQTFSRAKMLESNPQHGGKRHNRCLLAQIHALEDMIVDFSLIVMQLHFLWKAQNNPLGQTQPIGQRSGMADTDLHAYICHN